MHFPSVVGVLSLLLLAVCTGDLIDPPPPEPTEHEPNRVSIPIGGNAWVIDGHGSEGITEEGATNWTRARSVVRTYFRLARPGTLLVSVSLAEQEAGAQLELSVQGGQGAVVQGAAKPVSLAAGSEQEYFVGRWTVDGPGYVAVDLKGVSRQGSTFGRPTMIHVSGTAVTGDIAFVPGNHDNYFYWGRRGPSTHLWWQVPAATQVRWLYSELTVPTGNDVVGSYFMANGFQFGYFGMQVTTGQRQFLFSVWSPYQGDDPSSVPDAYRVKVMRKGDGVITNDFGQEGTGRSGAASGSSRP